ncbi:ABC transporter permease [Saccharothrix violaceirubra]|uniref:Putative ABC transport system permease protein n=1 Tax=Saccharothrix violaceirubra TaxID=413306 RepID=A0A7W7T2H3_9PSEU|nr:FtsX-like permease family protein [Saccharothrix violaceirubra]MBB4964797.1 putative ABC transport system permease protein [Saccharothrix violaceirubra]
MFKATLKSLLSRKVRLLLSGLSVVLGVMFVSGSFVLTDTLDRSFKDLFSSAYSDVDVQVSVPSKVDGDSPDAALSGTLAPADLAKVQAVDGVDKAYGDVVGSARPIGSDGKVLTTSGAPRMGTAWRDGGREEFREGHAPRADDEVAVSAYVAKVGGYKVGQRIDVLTLEPRRSFTVSGIFGYPGGRDSLGGEMITAFTTPTAQKLLLGRKDAYSGITAEAKAGVAQDALRDRVQSALGDGVRVKTGTQLAKESADQVGEGLKFFNYILLGFAGIALFVGIFIILNTFSILVAQRTRELALLRAMGAGRGQMIGTVVLEAVVIGLVASVVGLGAGIGVGAALAQFFATFGGSSLTLAGLSVPSSAIISAFSVGLVVTVLAALLPALRASRIPPVAAMREAATPDRPLTRPTIAGAVLGALGGTGLVIGFDQGQLTLIMGGLVVSFVGVALLTPLISRPVVSVIGRLLSWSVPGLLGRRNSARNPRRTAITAAALMVGIALITGVSVVLTSATASLTKIADTQIKADLIISGENENSGGGGSFTAADMDRVAKTEGVRQSFGWYGDQVLLDGKPRFAGAMTDVPAMHTIFGMTAKEGTLGDVRAGQIGLTEEIATEQNLKVGSTARLQTTKGEERTYTVAFVYAKSTLLSGTVVVPTAVAAEFGRDRITDAFVRVADGADAGAVRKRIEPLFADNPEISVQDLSSYVKQQASQLDTVLVMIQILLALAILIAVLGVINTLALSVIERTRELGLLRAIGMRRAQVMRMITVESVVISVFGALLGLVVGTGLGFAAVRALKDQGVTDLSIPWSQLGGYLALAAVVGVVAAILPAIRAARLNVLQAISYE